MSAAEVSYALLAEPSTEALPGKEEVVWFRCPKSGRRCGPLVIRGRTHLKHDPQNKNGGTAQWGWDGNRNKPTLTPSVNCSGCWHGYIRAGRCVNAKGQDE